MGTKPRAQQRPEPLDGVDMDLTEPIPIIVSSELPSGVADCPVNVSPLGQSSIDIVFISVHNSSGAIVARIRGSIVTCWTFSNIRITTVPARWIMPKMGGFSLASVPRPRSPFKR